MKFNDSAAIYTQNEILTMKERDEHSSTAKHELEASS